MSCCLRTTPLTPFSRCQRDERNEHFLHRDAAVLEGILVVLHIIVVIIRIGEETVARGKYIRGTQVRCRQLGTLRLLDGENFLALVSQILAQLVAQVGVRIAVAYNLDRFRCPDAAVVGGEHYLVIALRKELEELGENRMAEPALRDAAVGTLVVGKLAHHLRSAPCESFTL